MSEKGLPLFEDRDIEEAVALLARVRLCTWHPCADADTLLRQAQGCNVLVETDRFDASLSPENASRLAGEWQRLQAARRSGDAPMPGEEIWWLNDWDMGVYHDRTTGETRWATDDDWRRLGDVAGNAQRLLSERAQARAALPQW